MSTDDASLQDFKVTVTLTASGEERTFSVVVPAASADMAEQAGLGLAFGINEATDHVWKIRNNVQVEAA